MHSNQSVFSVRCELSPNGEMPAYPYFVSSVDNCFYRMIERMKIILLRHCESERNVR